MKKVFLTLLVLLTIFSFINVNAASKNIELVGIDIEDKSENIIVDEPVISSNEITSSIRFNELNDYVNFKLTLKNNENEKLKIESIDDNLENDNIEILYTFNSDNFISPNDTTVINVKMNYKNQLLNVDKLEINDLKIILNLVSEDGDSSSVDFRTNPKTGDNIIYYLIILCVTLVILFILLKKKIKRIKIVGLLLIFGLIAVPLFSYALVRYEAIINYKALIIKGEFQYIVSFDSDGGTIIDSQTVFNNKKASKPSDPIKTGYTFDNWYLDDDVFDFETPITGDVSLKAKYNIDEYNITYNIGDGTMAGNPLSYTIEDDDIVLNQPTPPAHYVFDGWTGSNGTTKEKTVTIPKGSTGDKEYIAHYSLEKYTIKFETNGGTIIDDQIVEYGQKVERPNDPTKLNNKFINWYTNDNYNTIFDFNNVLVEKSLIIYAKWDSFPTLFSHTESCTFNGHNKVITGDNCEYAGQYYIDTNIPLYSSDNYGLDYEFGFTIEGYSSTDNIKQATFVNTKYEDESIGWPGLVVRKFDDKDFLEVSETIHGQKSNVQFTPSIPLSVKVYRIDGIIYYSLDGIIMNKLQNIKETTDYFDTTLWFGASQALNGKPQRELNAVLSNMYVKLGKYDSNSKTVIFNPNGGAVNETSRVIGGINQIGELPIAESDDLEFLGWYTEPNGGMLIDSSSIVTGDITLYAHWDVKGAAKMNGEFYSTIQSAIDVAPDGATITVLKDVGEFLTVSSDKNIILNLNGHTIKNKNSSNFAIIENSGVLEVKNGTVTSSVKTAVINNNDTGSLIVDNVLVQATGLRQGVYNNGGNVTITGSSIIKASSSERAALHNKLGKIIIISGTIESSNYNAIAVDAGTLIVGEKNGLYDDSSIVVKGEKYGISTSVNISVYDGIIKGFDSSINNQSKITGTEDNSTIVTDDETIDGKSYKILYYVIN